MPLTHDDVFKLYQDVDGVLCAWRNLSKLDHNAAEVVMALLRKIVGTFAVDVHMSDILSLIRNAYWRSCVEENGNVSNRIAADCLPI